MKLKDKIVIVTGAGTGIGRAIAIRFAQEGATIVVADINEENSNEVAKEINKIGHQSLVIKTDVANEESVKNLVDKTLEKFSRIDIVISNAGVSRMAKFIDITEEDFDFNMDINTKGGFLVSKAVSEIMANQESGKIIFTISMAGKCGSPLYAHYNSSKAALLAYMQALALELAPTIKVNGVCPGLVKTSMQEREVKWWAELQGISEDLVKSQYLSGIPLGRLEEPEDVANLVAFLASEDGDYITGQAINVTGGMILRR
ncbi:MAG TPA: SDR family NAD(P)-dependent oxidoreductase [Candidatus Nanopelagicaceae bacterium]|jgi:meso-butanediol dehydrogenase/(S,S)-butanediol dehydrogenase/diacetyl reductase|nr:SDR family NAD(P)-dependent oxidoreductase [Candidatus Nanopelagicaceae bacterium]